MQAFPTLGMRVQFADGSYGQIVALRRAFLDGEVRVQIVAGPDEGEQVLIEDGERSANWVDVTTVTLLVPIAADADRTALQSRLADAKIALIRKQLDDRMDAIGDASDPTDVVLRGVLDVVPLVLGLPIPAPIIDAFVAAAHAVIREVAP